MLFDLNQLIKIDIINPPAQHRDYIEKEYHFLTPPAVLENDHDARITFRDDLKFDPVRAVSVGSPVGYDGDGVFWFDPSHEMARIDFDNFEYGTTPLTVSSRFNVHFLYILVLYLISFKAIRRGGVFCHAAAVHYRGKTLLMPAWRHAGKTNLLLAFVEDGGELIADDGVLLFDNGEILSYSKRVHLLYFNLMAYPQLFQKIEPSIRTLMSFVENACAGTYGLADETVELFQKLIRVRLPNSFISGKEHKPKGYCCDVVINLSPNFAESEDGVSLAPMHLGRLATKTTESTLFELSHFLTAYHTYALTQGKSIALLEESSERISNIFTKGFSKASGLFELTFNRHFDANEVKQLVDEYLNES